MKVKLLLISMVIYAFSATAFAQASLPLVMDKTAFDNGAVVMDKNGVSWNGGIQFKTGVMGNVRSFIVAFNGIPSTVRMTLSKYSAEISESVDKKTWTNVASQNDKASHVYKLLPTTRYLKVTRTYTFSESLPSTITEFVVNDYAFNVASENLIYEGPIYFGDTVSRTVEVSGRGWATDVTVASSSASYTVPATISEKSAIAGYPLSISFIATTWGEEQATITLHEATRAQSKVIAVTAKANGLHKTTIGNESDILFDRFTANWSPVLGATSYTVTMYPTIEDPNFNTVAFTNIPTNTPSLLVEGLKPNTEYKYAVTAHNIENNVIGLTSEERTVTTVSPFPFAQLSFGASHSIGTVHTDSIYITPFELEGQYLKGDVTLTATAPFDLSVDGKNWSNTLIVAKDAQNNISTTLKLRLNAPHTTGEVSGTIELSSTEIKNVITQLSAKAVIPQIEIANDTIIFDNSFDPVTPQSYTIPLTISHLRGDLNVRIIGSQYITAPRLVIPASECQTANYALPISYLTDILQKDTLGAIYLSDTQYPGYEVKIALLFANKLQPPHTLAATEVNALGFTANWQALAADSYLLSLFKKNPEGVFEVVESNRQLTTTSYTYEALEMNTVYRYLVQAKTQGVISQLSEPTEVTTLIANMQVTGELLPFETVYLKPSAAQTLQITASNLLQPMQIKVTEGYQLSLNGTDYLQQLSLSSQEITDGTATLYIRLNTNNVGQLAAELTFISVPMPPIKMAVTGTVSRLVSVIQELPTMVNTIHFGGTLGEIGLQGGSAIDHLGNKIAGSFKWKLGDQYVPACGSNEMEIYFSPDNNYGYEIALSTIMIKVLRKAQEITWDQDFSTLREGDEIELKARSTSGLPVSYFIEDGTIATVKSNNWVEALVAGMTRLVALQLGNATYEPAKSVTHYIYINQADAIDKVTQENTVVYYNKAMQSLTLKSDKSIKNLTVYNTMGEVVMTQSCASLSAYTFPVQLPVGICIVHLTYGDNTQYTSKIIVE